MMHGREKSDPAIVAKKPANNAGQPAAERVERRVGTEGNAGQQSTRRAQDRESVSQALERVRQAVCRQTPEVGAGCGKPARPDLCGGRPVTDVRERIFLLAARPGEGRFTQPTAAAQAWRPELVFMPRSRHLAIRATNSSTRVAARLGYLAPPDRHTSLPSRRRRRRAPARFRARAALDSHHWTFRQRRSATGVCRNAAKAHIPRYGSPRS